MTNDLAKIFTNIEHAAAQVEELASQILDAIKEAQADTLQDFEEMVGDAYDANGWNRQAGRPADGATLLPAPMTVRNYVSWVRRAYKVGLAVPEFETLGELRRAVKESKQKPAPVQHDELAAMRGVKMSKDAELIGAVVHDIGVVLTHLDQADQDEFEQRLQKLIKQFSKKAHIEVAAAA
jgi:hypothetical protein